mgnify:CR=1 FL=1
MSKKFILTEKVVDFLESQGASPLEFHTAPLYVRFIKNFKDNPDFKNYVVVDGNSAKLSKYMAENNIDIKVIGVPKTIDNDLVLTDHTPGFGSAAKYIAVTMQEIIRDCNVYKLPAVTIVEIMGRDAGWLTASAALASVNGHGPDLIYLPEVDFDTEKFIEDVKNVCKNNDNKCIATDINENALAMAKINIKK